MEGLLQQAQQPEQAPQEAPEAPQQQGMPSQDMSPQQIEQYKKGFQVAMQMIFEKRIFASILADVQGTGANGLAMTVVKVLEKVQEAVGRMDLMVAFALGMSILGELAEALNETGRFNLSEEDMTQAFTTGVSMWLRKTEADHTDQDKQVLQQLHQQGGMQ